MDARRLKELSVTTGRAPEELVEDAMAGYLAELAQMHPDYCAWIKGNCDINCKSTII